MKKLRDYFRKFFMGSESKHWCPACDQGWVEQVTIAPLAHKGWLCGECEAFWPSADARAIANEPFVQFGIWVREKGIEDAVKVERG